MSVDSPLDFKMEFDGLRDQSFLRTVEHFDELESTNSHALRLIAESPPDLPALIVARRQTAGRGRGNNAWWSADGGLTFSLIVDDAAAGFPVGGEPRIALLAGLAVADVLDTLLPPQAVGLKWPNDVQIKGRKVCGILTEVASRRRDVVVIGVGLNVNNSLASAPPELRATATALCDELRRELDLPTILQDVCRAMEGRFEEFVRDADSVRESFARRCVLTGRNVVARIGPRVVRGTCLGVHDDGSLIVETDDGRELLRSVDHVRPRSY